MNLYLICMTCQIWINLLFLRKQSCVEGIAPFVQGYLWAPTCYRLYFLFKNGHEEQWAINDCRPDNISNFVILQFGHVLNEPIFWAANFLSNAKTWIENESFSLGVKFTWPLKVFRFLFTETTTLYSAHLVLHIFHK